MAILAFVSSCGGAVPEDDVTGGTPSPGAADVGSADSNGSALAAIADPESCHAELTRAATQYESFRATYTNPNEIPRSVENGTVRLVDANDWTSGFPAGSFWLLYEFTWHPAWRRAAKAWTVALQEQSTRTDTHDLGFVINNTFGAGYRLTGSAEYAQVVRTAAESLAARYEPAVGATRSWDWGDWAFPVIIDNMMNLELLFHAAENDEVEALSAIATEHALTTRRSHFRPDGSSYHVVDFDPSDGAVLGKQTYQGLHDESAWARGQAWGLYGFTMVYRHTGDERFLDQAQRIADLYTQSPAMPEDGVPYFDFDAPRFSDVPDLRDASAGAIAASALLELSSYVAPSASERYRDFALKTIGTLSTLEYRAAPGTNGEFLLMHSVGNYPTGGEIDVALNYADYYYLEALFRCTRLDD